MHCFAQSFYFLLKYKNAHAVVLYDILQACVPKIEKQMT